MLIPHWQYGWLKEFYFSQYQSRAECPDAVFGAITSLLYKLLFTEWGVDYEN